MNEEDREEACRPSRERSFHEPGLGFLDRQQRKSLTIRDLFTNIQYTIMGISRGHTPISLRLRTIIN